MRFRSPLASIPFQLHLKIEKFWGADIIIDWNLNQDVNIITGINGSGKSTLLRLLYAAFRNDFSEFAGTDVFEKLTIELYGDKEVFDASDLKIIEKSEEDWDFSQYHNSLEAAFEGEISILYINTFEVHIKDIPIKGERIKTSLDLLLYKKGVEYAHYLKQLERRTRAENVDITTIYQAKNRFFEILNESFLATQKQVKEKKENSDFYFEKTSNGKILSPFQFSSGEKQFFYLLLSALVQDHEPTIFILDEPEISLHPEWQLNMISYIRELNPNATVVVATHSPEMLINGWSNKEYMMEDLVQPLSSVKA